MCNILLKRIVICLHNNRAIFSVRSRRRCLDLHLRLWNRRSICRINFVFLYLMANILVLQKYTALNVKYVTIRFKA